MAANFQLPFAPRTEPASGVPDGPAVLSDKAYDRIVNHVPGPETLHRYYEMAVEISQREAGTGNQPVAQGNG